MFVVIFASILAYVCVLRTICACDGVTQVLYWLEQLGAEVVERLVLDQKEVMNHLNDLTHLPLCFMLTSWIGKLDKEIEKASLLW